MKYCSNCATPIAFGPVEGEHLPRYYCPNCSIIHYQNPKVIVACLPIWENKVMLCRRGIEPQLGFWNIPGGFMENKESVEAGALREMLEETGCTGTLVGLHSVFTVLPVDQVHHCFLVELDNFNYTLTPESTEIQLFEEKDIPWTDIAFISNTFALKSYFKDRQLGLRQTHLGQYPRISSLNFPS
jgi:ADP-ribose pyrophosphatase YjhB (NUDIX family)